MSDNTFTFDYPECGKEYSNISVSNSHISRESWNELNIQITDGSQTELENVV